MKKLKLFTVICLAVMLTAVLAGCGAKSNYKGTLTDGQYNNLLKAYEAYKDERLSNLRDYYAVERDAMMYSDYCESESAYSMNIIANSDEDGKAKIFMEYYRNDFFLFKQTVYEGMGDGVYDICLITAEINGDDVKITDILHDDGENNFGKLLPAKWRIKYMLDCGKDEFFKKAGGEAAKKLKHDYDSKRALGIFFDVETGKDMYEIFTMNTDKIVETGELKNSFRAQQLETVTKFRENEKICDSCDVNDTGYCANPEAWQKFYSQVRKKQDAEIMVAGKEVNKLLSFKDGKFYIFENMTANDEQCPYDLRAYNFLVCEETPHGTMYILTDDQNMTYNTYLKNTMSAVDYENMVWCELIMAVENK